MDSKTPASYSASSAISFVPCAIRTRPRSSGRSREAPNRRTLSCTFSKDLLTSFLPFCPVCSISFPFSLSAPPGRWRHDHGRRHPGQVRRRGSAPIRDQEVERGRHGAYKTMPEAQQRRREIGRALGSIGEQKAAGAQERTHAFSFFPFAFSCSGAGTFVLTR
jgi:hypothetical protein